MSSMSGKVMNYLFGINADEGPVYFATSVLKEKLKLDAIDTPLTNGIFYNICINTGLSNENLVQERSDISLLKEHIDSFFSSEDIVSSFLVCYDENSYRNGFSIKFKKCNDPEECTTETVLKIATSLGLVSVSKLIPNKQGFHVDVISCDTKEVIEHFHLSSVKYIGHYPMFDYGHSVYKSFEEVVNILDSSSTSLQEIDKLKYLADNLKDVPSSSCNTSCYPFIVIEGLDAVGKSTLVSNLAKQIGAEVFHTPPSCIECYRELFVKQSQPVVRAYYSLGNYLIVKDIRNAVMKCPVILDRYYYSSAAYAIAFEAKCGDESNIPPQGHPIYEWPRDLLKPTAVIFLTLNEKDRSIRMRNRGYSQTNEEDILGKSQLMRQRLIAAYQNMNDPSCIIIDASKSKEEVCQEVIMSLKQNNILT